MCEVGLTTREAHGRCTKSHEDMKDMFQDQCSFNLFWRRKVILYIERLLEDENIAS